MRMLYTLMAFVFCAVSVNAKIWTVSPRPGAHFTTLSGAVGSASVLAGDTILVSGSSQAYSGFTVGKRLTIIGPGYFLNENTGLQADTNTAKINTNVNVNAQGTKFMGLHFLASLYINADNVTIERCRMQVTSAYDYPVYVYSKDSVVVRQCYITQTATWYHCVTVQNGATQFMLHNNFIEYTGGNNNYGSINIQGTVSGEISNNVILGDIDNQSGGFVFNNNILRGGTFSTTGVTPYNNIGSSTQFGNQNGNQENVDMNSVFTMTGSIDAKWQLAGGGPAVGTGFGGVDCGMYDTSAGAAYVISGIPAVPSIYEFTADPDLNNVTVKVKSHN